jgi:UDP-N-acetylmuramoyl-tripeptide--D-alanyl-D-alanine ligase
MNQVFRRETLWRIAARFLPVFYWIAFLWRRLLPRTTVIAITGSLGKTTTKECLADVLESVGPTYRTYRNQNSLVLVTLNVLRIRRRHRYAVLEVASAAPGQIGRPARLVRPDVVIMLNVLRTHTTAFIDLEQHAKEKTVLLQALKPGGIVVMNDDDPLVSRMPIPKGARVYRFGSRPNLDFRVDQISSVWPERLKFVFHSGAESREVRTQLVGSHWVTTAAAVLATTTALGVDLDVSIRALSSAKPFPGRLQPVQVPGGAIILRDDYNAAIDTIDASLNVLEKATALRRLVVITDMSDFGRNRKQRLKYLASRTAEVADGAVFVGELADYGKRRAIEAGLRPEMVHAFPSMQPAAEFLQSELKPGDVMLLKGRTTDHATRIFYAQLGTVKCWKEYCGKRMLCDLCPELGLTREERGRFSL